MISTIFKRSAGAALALAVMAGAASALDISGAGATFPYPIYAKWAEAYKKETGNGLNYQSIGSGGGIKQIKARTVTFGASDQPLKADDLQSAGLSQWPQVIGGIVPVVNLEGVKGGELTLDGDTLAKIFLGEITKWDDAPIKKLNPKAKLTSAADRRGPSFGRLGHDLQLHQLSVEGFAGLEVESRRERLGRVAGRHRREGQRRRR